MKSIFISSYTFLICSSIFSQAPNVEWAYNFGATNSDAGVFLKKDSKGNIYNLGRFRDSANFDPYFKSGKLFNMAYSGNNGYLTKFTSEGRMIWALNRKETHTDLNDFFIGEKNDIYIFGHYTGNANIGFLNDTSFIQSNSNLSYYISKYDEKLNLIYSKTLDGLPFGSLTSLKSKGDTFYLISYIRDSVRLDPESTNYTFFSPVKNYSNLFIAKYTPDGKLIDAKEIKNAFSGWGFRDNTDLQGNLILCFSFTDSVDVDPGPMEYYIHAPDSNLHLAICKYDSQMNLMWAKSIGGNKGSNAIKEYYSWASIESVISDDSMNIFLSGSYDGEIKVFDNPTIHYFSSAPNCYWSQFLMKLDKEGNLVWVNNFTKPKVNFQSPTSIALDSLQNIYFSSFYRDTFDFNFDTINSFILSSWNANGSALIASYDKNGKFRWARNYYNYPGVEILDIMVTSIDKFYMTGIVYSRANSCNNRTEYNGDGDIILAKFSECAPVFCLNHYYIDICNSLSTEFEVEVKNIAGIQWLRSIDNGQSWMKINNGSVFNGVNTNKLKIIKVDSSFDNNLFSCELSNYCSYIDTSVSFRVNVIPFNKPEIFKRNDTLFVKSLKDINNFQWFDCFFGSIISGETKSFFVPKKSGNYAAKGINNNCDTISNCIQILITSDENNSNSKNFKIYPNPAKDKLLLEFISDSKINIEIYNLLGIKETSHFSNIAQDHYEIDIKNILRGNKIIKITNERDGMVLLKHLFVMQ